MAHFQMRNPATMAEGTRTQGMTNDTGVGSHTSAELRQREAKIQDAGRKALEYKEKGFHCSESVFLAINDTLKITDPCMVKIVTGFHGGGGTHRLDPDLDLTPFLADVAAGRIVAEPDELPMIQVQHLCGALAASIACVGLLHGRCSPEDDLTCVDELCYELHRRFNEDLGSNECHALREIWVPQSEDQSCAHVYRKGTRIALEVILSAHELVPECPPFQLEP
jgi:hypothetical protein